MDQSTTSIAVFTIAMGLISTAAALPPAVVASTLAALKRMEEEPALRERLNANAARLYHGLSDLGFHTGPQIGPIVAVAMPDQACAVAFWNTLLERGVYLNLALPPATPDSRPLLRSSISAAHTFEQIDTVIRLFGEIGREFGVIEGGSQRATA